MLAGFSFAAHGAQPALPLLGDYLDEGYLQTLQTSLSPAEAGAEDTRLRLPEVISVQADAAGRRIALDYGWREGRLLLILRPDGRMFRPIAWNSPVSLALRVGPAGRLCLADRRVAREHCYRYVQDARTFVTHTALAGRWRDRQGQAYCFSTRGQAHFPGYDFGYALALEESGRGYDSFRIAQSGRAMVFRHAGALMMLFAAPQAGAVDFGRPLAVLRPEESGAAKLVKTAAHAAACHAFSAETSGTHHRLRCRHMAGT